MVTITAFSGGLVLHRADDRPLEHRAEHQPGGQRDHEPGPVVAGVADDESARCRW